MSALRLAPICLLLAGCAASEVHLQGITVSYEPYDDAPSVKSSAKNSEFPDVDIPYEKHILPNGLTLILHEDHKAPLVAVNLWYHVGSKDEKPGKTGFAHLFEHLMFQQSEHHHTDYIPALEAIGADDLNGTTNNDRTNFFETVPTSALDHTLWLESDRMGWLLGAIDQAALDEQRGVVQNEKRQHVDNAPYGRVYELMESNTYPAGHPYSWATIGSMADLDAASLADVKQWFRDYYGAANVTLVIGGDINPAEVKKKVEHYFGDIPAGARLSHQDQWIAKMQGAKRATLQDRVPQTRIYQVWNVPGTADGQEAVLSFAAQVLGGDKNSRLYKRLVYRDQIATDVSAGLWNKKLGSQFIVQASVKPGGDAKAVEKALDEERQRFLREGPSSEELQRVKTSFYADWVRGIERIGGFGGKTDILAYGDVMADDPEYYKGYLRRLRDATPTQVGETARAWLSDGVFVLTVDPVPDYTAAKSGADRTHAPPTGQPPALILPALQRTTLSNGLKIALAERHAAPVVQMSLMLDAGFVADTGVKRGTSSLTLSMLDEGAGKYDALALAARKSILGAQISAESSADLAMVTLSAIKVQLADSLDLYSDVALRPIFSPDELARLKLQYAADLQQQKAQPSGIVRALAPALIYGPAHPYATNAAMGLNSEAELAALNIDDLKAFHKRWFRPDNATLLIVGDTTLAEIKPLLEARFGNWKAPAEPWPTVPVPAVTAQDAPRVFLIDKPGAAQSYIWAGELTAPIRDPADTAMRTVNAALGGIFTSRINLNLREGKHWSYGASSRIANNRGQRVFAAAAPVETAHTAESVSEMQKEMQDLLGKRPLQGTEIKLAKDAQVLSLPASNETAPQVASSYAHILAYGLPDTYYNDFVGEVTSLTPEQLSAAARKLVHPEALTWVLVGDLAKIEEPVRKLKLGDVKVLDADGKTIR